MTLTAPMPLTATHDLANFACGIVSLDEWLRRRALANQVSGASRTYVVAEGERVVGYYCLASGALAVNAAPGAVRRNMPEPIPMAILGRLAIDQSWQGRGLGAALLRDAVERTTVAAGILGIRGVLVHALDEAAKTFYAYHGFIASLAQPMTLVFSVRQELS